MNKAKRATASTTAIMRFSHKGRCVINLNTYVNFELPITNFDCGRSAIQNRIKYLKLLRPVLYKILSGSNPLYVLVGVQYSSHSARECYLSPAYMVASFLHCK